MKSVGWIAWDMLQDQPASAGYKSACKLYKSKAIALRAIHGRLSMVPIEVFAETPEAPPEDLQRCRACGHLREEHNFRHPFR